MEPLYSEAAGYRTVQQKYTASAGANAQMHKIICSACLTCCALYGSTIATAACYSYAWPFCTQRYWYEARAVAEPHTHLAPQRSTQPLVYAAECQAVIRQVTGSWLSGNMLIFQASVSVSGKRFSASYMRLWHSPCQRTPLGCK